MIRTAQMQAELHAIESLPQGGATARGSFAHVEALVGDWVHLIGIGIDLFGVLVIVCGIGWASYLFLWEREPAQVMESYKVRIGRSLLLGLEVLVAADIIKTIAIEPTLDSLVMLAGLVAVRTFLSWTLVLEIEGRWPWSRSAGGDGAQT